MDSLIIPGTPGQVSAQIPALREQTGDFGTLVYAARSRRSMELMAHEVMPAGNEAITKDN